MHLRPVTKSMPTHSATRGQSEVMGLALILALVIFGTTAIVVLGASAFDATEERSETLRAEQTMTLFDSRAAMVALGESDSQSISLRGQSGEYEVNTDTGWLRITHTNYSDGTGEKEVIYNRSLGSVVYSVGGTDIAYQGGGVWRLDEKGDARMVSPPEFHYRGSTLTLPVVRVTGGSGSTSAGDVSVRRTDTLERIYPNTSRNYNGSDSPDLVYDNPAENGSMTVTVKSEFYVGWAEYFRERTSGNVSVDHANNTATVDLTTLGSRGGFVMPKEQESLTVRGLKDAGHSLKDFSIRLVGGDGANFDSLQFSMYAGYADDEAKELELYVKNDGDGEVKVAIYYSDDNGDTHAGWLNEDAFTIQTGDVDGDGDTEQYVDVDFTGDINMTYQELSNDDVNKFKPGNAPLVDPEPWNQHEGVSVFKNGVSTTENVSYSATDTAKIRNVTSHYFELMPAEFELTVKEKQGGGEGSIDNGASSGTINYPGSDRFITFLHVTDNEIEVKFDD